MISVDLSCIKSMFPLNSLLKRRKMKFTVCDIAKVKWPICGKVGTRTESL